MGRSRTAVLAAVAALALGACGGGPEPAATTAADTSPVEDSAEGTAEPTPSGTGENQPAATAGTVAETDEPDLPFATAPNQDPAWPGSGGDLLPTTVRIGNHTGFDRVVFDLAGSGAPGWRVQYVDVAVEDPRGQEVDVEGDATLEVVMSGMRYHEESETDLLITGAVDVEGDGVVEEVLVSGIFEGLNQAFIGVDEQRPFRVFTLADPARLVVDIQTGA